MNRVLMAMMGVITLVALSSRAEGKGEARAVLRGDYLEIDLSAGATAFNYPMRSLDAVPSGGWTDEYKCSKLVLRRISAGSFLIGASSNASPQEVQFKDDFYIGVFEVTQRQWELVMGSNPSYFTNKAYYSMRPVEMVNFDDIRGSSKADGAIASSSFIGKLQERTALAFDVPNESQWEYACRAGSPAGLGDELHMDEIGRYWYNGGSSCAQDCTSSGGTARVGSYKPNAWGLYDMHGNVFEWCLPWAGFELTSRSDKRSAACLLRGGGYGSGAQDCCATHRREEDATTRHSYIGFRLYCVPLTR